MFGSARICLLCAALSLGIGRVRGDRTFQWTFGNNYVQQSFEECQTLQVVVESLTSDTSKLGVPPYYLFAFEVGGVPTVSMVGSNPSNLTWTANHKRGTKLMLTMMDSNMSTGGIPPNLFTMQAGNDQSCLPSEPPTTQLASIHPNVTDTITTCQPWGLTISGGKKPYTVVLSALNSPVITNVTMGSDDDVFTFIDRADPNGQLMASVVDATGQWGISSNITKTAGSTNVDCVGLVSSSKTSAEIAQEEANAEKAAQDADNRRRTRLIVGLVVGLGVPILLGLAFAVWLYKRRRPEIDNGTWDNQDVIPRPLPYSTGQGAPEMRETGGETSPPTSPGSKSTFTVNGPMTPNMEITPIPPVYFDREIAQAQRHVGSSSGAVSGSSSEVSPPMMTRSGSASTGDFASARYRKALEASRGHLLSTQTSSTSLNGLPATPRPGPRRRQSPTSLSSSALINAPLDLDIQPDIIIQHRDGGVVQELPPPYADRSGQATPPSHPPSPPSSTPPLSQSSASPTSPAPSNTVSSDSSPNAPIQARSPTPPTSGPRVS